MIGRKTTFVNIMVDSVRKTYLKTIHFSKFKKFQPVLKIAENPIRNVCLKKCNPIDEQLYFVIGIVGCKQFVPRIVTHLLGTCETVYDFNNKSNFEFIRTVQQKTHIFYNGKPLMRKINEKIPPEFGILITKDYLNINICYIYP